MELCINYLLYGISLIAVFTPFFGFGAAPGLIVNTAIISFVGNSLAQLKDQKLLDGWLAKNKDKGLGKTVNNIFDQM